MPAKKPKMPVRKKPRSKPRAERETVEQLETLARQADATHNEAHRREIIERLMREATARRPLDERRKIAQLLVELRPR